MACATNLALERVGVLNEYECGRIVLVGKLAAYVCSERRISGTDGTITVAPKAILRETISPSTMTPRITATTGFTYSAL
jgi:hypothetical protein